MLNSFVPMFKGANPKPANPNEFAHSPLTRNRFIPFDEEFNQNLNKVFELWRNNIKVHLENSNNPILDLKDITTLRQFVVYRQINRENKVVAAPYGNNWL